MVRTYAPSADARVMIIVKIVSANMVKSPMLKVIQKGVISPYKSIIILGQKYIPTEPSRGFAKGLTL